jgi:hypothetical protein
MFGQQTVSFAFSSCGQAGYKDKRILLYNTTADKVSSSSLGNLWDLTTPGRKELARNEMPLWTCSTHLGSEKQVKTFPENLYGRHNLGDLGVDGM